MTLTIDLKTRHIDNHFYRLTHKEARAIADAHPGHATKLPRYGYEWRVEVNGEAYWLTRTIVNRRCVWALHTA